MDCAGDCEHFKFDIYWCRDQNIFLHFLALLLLALLHEACSDVGQQVLLDPVFLQLQNLADSIALLVRILLLGSHFILWPKIKPDAEAQGIVLVLLEQKAITR